jgi:mono/diheme cytochrome c family protein
LRAINAIPCGFLLLAACRQDMHDQPRYEPLQTSSFFADGRASRPIPVGTVARDDVVTPGVLQTGDRNGDFSDVIPVKLDLALLKRGQERYDIYCVPCHGYLGDGDGMISRRGVRVPANLNSDRIRQAPPGYIFQVITKGYGAMGDYADQIPSDTDRWAIVAYVRALELSQNATVDQVPAADRAKLEGAAQ